MTEWRHNNFDLIRLLAALQVVIVHSISKFGLSAGVVAVVDTALRLFPGVPIFFLISGFLISASYQRAGSLREYLRNRCLRIFPALWVCLVATISVLAVLIATGAQVKAIASGPWLLWWFTQMSSSQFYAADFLQAARLNTPLWTIPVEMEFYLLLPICFALLRRRRGQAALCAVISASLAAHWTLFHTALFTAVAPYLFVLDTAAPYLWIFLTGVLIQRHWAKVSGYVVGRAAGWMAAYVLFALALRHLHVNPGSVDFNGLFLLPLAGVVMSCATTSPDLAARVLKGNDISYGTYVYHWLVITLLLAVTRRHTALLALAAVFVSMGLGTLSWFLVERPFLQRKHRSLYVSDAPPFAVALK
jgi:peptidoglycan/LPS O-acetylase OafA/YrhL